MRQASSSSAWRSRRADDERVDGAKHLEGAVEPLDAALLRFERAGLLQELVDHHAQVLLVEIPERPAAGASLREASAAST